MWASPSNRFDIQTMKTFLCLLALILPLASHAKALNTIALENGGQIVLTDEAPRFACPLQGGMRAYLWMQGGQMLEGCWFFGDDLPGYGHTYDVVYQFSTQHHMYPISYATRVP